MYYSRITVENFKGIKKVEIDFINNRIITLVGLNESGKTTILEAINLFYQLIKDRNLTNKEINSLRPKGIDFTGAVKIGGDLTFEESDYNKVKEYLQSKNHRSVDMPTTFGYSFNFNFKVHSYQDSSRISTFLSKIQGQKTLLHNSNKKLWLELVNYIRVNLVPEILLYEDFIFDIPNDIFFKIVPTETLEVPTESENVKKLQWQQVIDDILKTVNPQFSSFQEYVANIWEQDNDTARQRVNAMEKLLDKKITVAWKELFTEAEEDKNLKKLNFKEIKLLCNNTSGNLTISFKVKTESGKDYSINERSKGCKWFFSFLIFTEFRKHRTKNILFLLDEPASNLHSSAQIKILDAIEELSDKSMVVYSTHSHHLINPKWLNGAYVVVNEGISQEQLSGALTDNDAKIHAEKYFNYVSKNEQKNNVLYFQPILDRLDYKPSYLEPIPNIVICEGKND